MAVVRNFPGKTKPQADPGLELTTDFLGFELRYRLVTDGENAHIICNADDFEMLHLWIENCVDDSPLSRLKRRYDRLCGQVMNSIKTGGEIEDGAFAIGKKARLLAATYRNLVKLQKAMGLEPEPKNETVVEAHRQGLNHYRRGQRLKAAGIITPAHVPKPEAPVDCEVIFRENKDGTRSIRLKRR